MEGSSSPSTFNQRNQAPSMLSPPPPFSSLLDEDLVSWSDPHSPQLFPPGMQHNEPVNEFHYSDGQPQDPMISPDVIDEGSSTNAEQNHVVGNPTEFLRNSWMANYSQFVDGNKVYKVFNKHAKEKVATINTIKASVARRRNPAKFKCSIQGCGADFTRKHNLEIHLKSHCGVTDRICGLCGKGFTTIPVWKRHQKSCEKAASSSNAATPKGFLDAVTARRPA